MTIILQLKILLLLSKCMQPGTQMLPEYMQPNLSVDLNQNANNQICLAILL